MIDYIPKVGEEVRALMPEKFPLFGRVTFVNMNSNQVGLEFAAESWAILNVSDGWKFYPKAALPTRVGAIVRRADGQLFVREGGRGQVHWLSLDGRGENATDETAIAGGFTTEFEGLGK